MVGLFQPAVEYRRLRLSFVFTDLGCRLRGDRQSDSSTDIQGAFFYPGNPWNRDRGDIGGSSVCGSVRNRIWHTETEQETGCYGKDCGRTSGGIRQGRENIYESVMDTLEFQEEKKKMLAAASSEFKEKLEAASELRERIGAATEEQKARIEELKKKYTELAGRSTKVSVRLMKAFPKMESRNHRELLDAMKLRLKKRPEIIRFLFFVIDK